ncbi:MAG: LmeA family phospholipid-binding protein [Mycobacterium sp.]
MTDPWARPADQPQPGPLTSGPPPQHPPQGAPGQPPPGGPAQKDSSLLGKVGNLFRDPLSIVLVVVIVVALIAAGLIGAELYARSRADDVVASATECVVKDDVTVSFGATPFLLQHMTGHYSNISIETAGNQIRDAKGMKAQINIDDVRLQSNGNSKGTIGALDATINWTADGIKQTVQNSIPILGSFVTDVKTNPSDGTIELEAALGSVTTKPTVTDGGIALQMVNLNGLGFTLPREMVQPALDAFSAQLTKGYPLGVKADDVKVSDTGVTAHFSTRNASIPAGNTDPCFAGL